MPDGFLTGGVVVIEAAGVGVKQLPPLVVVCFLSVYRKNLININVFFFISIIIVLKMATKHSTSIQKSNNLLKWTIFSAKHKFHEFVKKFYVQSVYKE